MNTQATIIRETPTGAPSPSQDDARLANGAACLSQMDELRTEIQSAMLAIAGNSLPALEGSLWRQEVLCTSLKHLVGTLQPAALEGPLAARIREASLALQQLNLTYSHLLQQSSLSADLLLRLCSNYREQTVTPHLSSASARQSLGARQSWSCEA